MTNDSERPPLEQPLAELERQLIRAYVAGTGQDLETLRARDDNEARKILAEASRVREHEAGRGRGALALSPAAARRGLSECRKQPRNSSHRNVPGNPHTFPETGM